MPPSARSKLSRIPVEGNPKALVGNGVGVSVGVGVVVKVGVEVAVGVGVSVRLP